MSRVLALLALVTAVPAGAQERVELKIAATTDVHGRLRSWDYYANADDPARGLSRVATIVDSLRRAAPGRVVLVDAGDLLQGNPMTYVAARVDSLAPHPVVAAMNTMRYDAAALGNHEFNYGLDILDRATARAKFPFLAANAERLDGGKPYPARTMVTRGKVKVAIIGVTTPGSMVWDRDNLKNRMVVRDIVAALPAQVEAARADGADVVVVVAHAGLEGEASYDTVGTALPSENPMARVAREVSGIDMIVIGHSHREMADTTINGVLLVQPRNWATSLSIATLSMEKQGGRWRVAQKSGVLVQARGHAEHPALVKAVARAHVAAVTHSTEVIGRTAVAWRTDSARVQDMPLIDLIQEVQRKATGAQLSVASAFTLSASIPPGPITVSQIAQLYPYENSLRAVKLTGAQVKAFLEQSAKFWVVESDGRGGVRARPDPRIPGYNFDILAGAEYTMDLSRPMGSRIVGLTYNGTPMVPTDSFTVAVNNYRAGGAGGYDMLRNAPVVFESPVEIRDLLIQDVRRRGELKPDDVFVQNWMLVPPQRTLRIIAINDFHGALLKRPDGNAGNRGGAAEVAAELKRYANECLPLCTPILLHGGDLFQGTPASNLTFGRSTAEILNTMGFAAGALGNHEFDWGQDTLRARLQQLTSPVLGANVTYVDGRDVPWIPDDTLLTIGGVRVGVIGIADPATPFTTMPKHVADLRFLPPAPIIKTRAVALRARGAEFVVVVAHLGGFCDIDAPDRCRGEIMEVSREIGAGTVDAIVSGHTHSLVATIVEGTPIVQARNNGRSIGIIDLPVGVRGGEPVRPQVFDVVSDRITPDSAVQVMVARTWATIADRVNAPVVENAERLPRSGDQYALGNLIADAQRLAGKGDVGVMNNGGIRAELRAGTVTWGQIFEVQPFENRLVAVTIRGDALRRYFEALVSGNGVRYHVSGVRLEFDRAAPVGSRLRKITMGDGSPLDDRRRYRVVMTNFMSSGGDGAALAKDATIEEINLLDLDALINHLRALPGGRLVATPALSAPRIIALP
ncbi:MAG: 5'-nucleotidase C-terminal domain-containing protein [Gemmatimonadaceae bacterium]|nr:5'-nucleotidase C-terminal domain-containing protein [Gemmatimonadaceae bacterium]